MSAPRHLPAPTASVRPRTYRAYTPSIAAAMAVRDVQEVRRRAQSGFHRYEDPGEVEAVLERVQVLAQELSGLITEAAGWLGSEQATGRLGWDGTAAADMSEALAADVAVDVTYAVQELGRAAGTAAELALRLDTAREVTEYLTGRAR